MKRKAQISKERLPASFESLVLLYAPRAIRDDVDYANTQELIDRLTDLQKLTPGQAEYLDTLATLLHAYEDQQFPIQSEDITPANTLRYLLEQRDMTPTDLGRLVGSRSLAEKVLRGEGELTQSQIRTIANFFQVNPGLLL